MQFQVGYFYRYTGPKKKTFTRLECIYADTHTAVVRPWYACIKSPGPSFAIPQAVTHYALDTEYTHLSHQIEYYKLLRDQYRFEVEKATNALKTHQKHLEDIEATITHLEKGKSL